MIFRWSVSPECLSGTITHGFLFKLLLGKCLGVIGAQVRNQ